MTTNSAPHQVNGTPNTLTKSNEEIHMEGSGRVSTLADEQQGSIKNTNTHKVTINTPNESIGPLFNLSLVEEMDDNEYVAEILTLFLGNTPKDLNDLKSACLSNSMNTAYKTAHKIKGSTMYLQANAISQILNEIEANAKAGNGEGLLNLSKLAQEEYKKMEPLLKLHLRNIMNRKD